MIESLVIDRESVFAYDPDIYRVGYRDETIVARWRLSISMDGVIEYFDCDRWRWGRARYMPLFGI